MNDKTEREIYDERKLDMLSEDQIGLGSDIMQWYRASWHDKNSKGYFDLWQQAERYYEGNVNQQVSETDPASNTNIVHPNIETLVGMTVDRNMAAEVSARTPSEEPYIQQCQTIIDYIMEQNKIVLKSYSIMRRMTKFGTGIARVLFNPDKDIPEIRSVNPAYLFVDPNIVDPLDLQSAKFIIETKVRNIHSAREEFGDIADAIFPGYDPIEDARLFGEDIGMYNEEGRQNYIHMYVFFKDIVEIKNDDEESEKEYEYKIRLIEMSADGVILRDSYDSEIPPYFPKEQYPYIINPNYEREGSFWGKGDLELLMDSQDQLNDYDDQIRSNARLFGNPQKYADPTSGLELDMWTNDGGLILPVIGGRDKIGYLQPYTVSQDIVNRRDNIMNVDTTKLIRVNSQMMGQRQKGVDSATEALSLRESSNTVIDPKIESLEDLLSDALLYAFRLAIKYWDDDMFFKVTGKKSFVNFNPSRLESIPALEPADEEFNNSFRLKNPEKEVPKYMNVNDTEGNIITKEAEIDIKVRVGNGPSKNPTFTYSVMKESMAQKVIKKSTYLNYMKNVIGAPIPQEEIDEAMSIEQLQMQQLLGAIQPQGSQGAPGIGNQMQPTGQPMSPNEDLMGGLNASGTPQRPQAAERGVTTSIGNNIR